MALQRGKTRKNISSGMTKKQISEITINIKDYFLHNNSDIKAKIAEDLFSDPTMKSHIRQSLVTEMLSISLIKLLCDKFCDIYNDCNVGKFKDKYSLLQIRWSEWIARSLQCRSSENILLIPDVTSKRKKQDYESNDISAVLHAIAANFFDVICGIIKSIRPSHHKQAIVSHNVSQSPNLTWVII